MIKWFSTSNYKITWWAHEMFRHASPIHWLARFLHEHILLVPGTNLWSWLFKLHSTFFSSMIIRFRCLKYWLKEEIKGQTEIFVDNLTAAPDNIKLAPDGSFWIALVEVSYKHLSVAEKVHLLCQFNDSSVTVYSSWTKFCTLVKSFKTFAGNFPQIDKLGHWSIPQSYGSECRSWWEDNQRLWWSNWKGHVICDICAGVWRSSIFGKSQLWLHRKVTTDDLNCVAIANLLTLWSINCTSWFLECMFSKFEKYNIIIAVGQPQVLRF